MTAPDSRAGGFIPVAPSMEPALSDVRLPAPPLLMSRRDLVIAILAVLLGAAAAVIADALVHLIGLITNLCFYGRFSDSFVDPGGTTLGWPLIFIPAVGGVIVGIMARYGSIAIRGHGIPEAMEQVLLNQSRIPPRVTLLKPLSAAIAIGTGGPFG
ncbi:MAG: chloride channel protein, partial [Thermoanaerobaculia bacterium]